MIHYKKSDLNGTENQVKCHHFPVMRLRKCGKVMEKHSHFQEQ